MTIKASQRAGAKALALHLTNDNDNEHVTVHEVRGFMSDDIFGAFTEMEANARGTQCVKHMFSLSINPPIGADLSTRDFMETADLIEEKMGLSDQPRVLVFHEKEHRLHAHVVWSRIEANTMKAINLPFFKNRLNEIARDQYIKHGWELPKGYVGHEKRDPHNYSLAEYQQAKRLDQEPKVIKTLLQMCWKNSDNRDSFATSINEHGYFLARGDRRGYVAISMTGEILSLSRFLGAKSNDLKAVLGDHQTLPSVDEVQVQIEKTHKNQFDKFQAALNERKKERLSPLLTERTKLVEAQRSERIALYEKQMERRRNESINRQDRYRNGLLGLWDCLRGRNKSIAAQNQQEACWCKQRDSSEFDQLRIGQRKARAHILFKIRDTKREFQSEQRRISQIQSHECIARNVSNIRTIQHSKDQELDLGR